MSFNDLNEQEQFIYMWQYRMLGGFKQALMEAICRADESNLIRLGMGFPVEVGAYRLFAHMESWWPAVQRKMETADAPPEKTD